MKKVILALTIMSAMLVFHVPKAQGQGDLMGTTTTPAVKTANTLTGGFGSYYSYEVPVLNTSVDTLQILLSGSTNILIKVSARMLKTSGTIAGTTRLYGSMYGTTGTWHPIGDTATNSNAAVNEHQWNLTGNDLGWRYVRALQDGGTTMAGTISVKAYGIKQQ